MKNNFTLPNVSRLPLGHSKVNYVSTTFQDLVMENRFVIYYLFFFGNGTSKQVVHIIDFRKKKLAMQSSRLLLDHSKQREGRRDKAYKNC